MQFYCQRIGGPTARHGADAKEGEEGLGAGRCPPEMPPRG